MTLRFETIDPSGPQAVGALRQYFAELDEVFDGGFDPGDAIDADAAHYIAPDGAFVVAVDDGQVVACGAVLRHDADTAEIKRMWVASAWRGVGVGRRMLTELEGVAARAGYHRVVLDTNATLTTAIAMYASAGYSPTERYNDNPYAQRWFTKALSPVIEPR